MTAMSTGQDRGSGRYEIRVKGHLEHRWAASFDGMTLTNESDGTTSIHGPVIDQAALHGVLRRLRDTGPAADLGHATRPQSAAPIHYPPPRKERDMNAPLHTPASTRPPMDPMRQRSLAAGILYLITFVSIP